jgi:oligopeptidase B
MIINTATVILQQQRTPGKVYFGVHPLRPDELKGPNPMNPPLEREDNYFWLRDDERKNEEVIK